jgi:hypothetical protein
MSRESDLVKLLSEKTKAGTQSWDPTAVDDEFVTVVGDFSVFVRSADDPDSRDPDVFLTIRDKENHVILYVRNGDAEMDVMYPQLQELHELARRKALKIDQALDTLLKSLK